MALCHNVLVLGIQYSHKNSNSMQMDLLAAQSPISSENEPQHLLELTVTFTSNEQDEITDSTVECTGKIPVERGHFVLALTHWVSSSSGHKASESTSQKALVELENGQLWEYQKQSGASGSLEPVQGGMMEALLEPCPWIVGLEQPSQLPQDEEGGVEDHPSPEQIVIGMSWSKRLYCGDVLLADSITSFYVSDRFLCYATTATTTTATAAVTPMAKGAASGASQLKFIALSQLFALDPFMGASEENTEVIAAEYEPRNVERGSRIVSVLRNKPMVILQLPRGNLEGVAPRALVLPHILQHVVSKGNYKAALEMMRQQKVDLNLLVDWNPVEFLNKGAHDLLQQVTNVDHLNLFISSLRNENVTQTRHILPNWLLEEFRLGQYATDGDVSNGFDFSTKVNQVCQKLREIMAEKAQVGDDLLLPVLSTFAKEDPPKLESALSLIQEKALGNEEAGALRNKKPPLFSDKAQSSIQYLAFLANYNLLFDTALGMYELDLARAVARNSQMDPKIYLPLLKRYRELPHYYARYEIDLRLKRYPQALRNLVQSIQEKEESSTDLEAEGTTTSKLANTFDDALGLVKQHKFHRLGLELFHEANQQREILLDLGDHLLQSGQAENALTMFMTISEPIPSEQILRAAKKCQDWRTYFSYYLSTILEQASEVQSANIQSKAKEVVEELVSSVASAQLERKRQVHSDASRIMLDYCGDASEAVDLLLQAELWSEGRRIAMLHNDSALVEKSVEAAVAHAHSTMESLPDRASTFVATMERYIEVLKIRKEAYAKGEDEFPTATPLDEGDTGSLFSAASQASHLTSASATSSTSTSTSASYSTVISVTSNTDSSFSITGTDQSNRHKSKYNQIGSNQRGQQRQKKKQKKGKSKSSRIIPGSEKELQTLVDSLLVLGVDVSLGTSVADCIVFLTRSGRLSLASEFYKIYQACIQKIRNCQESRQAQDRAALQKQEEMFRREGMRAAEDILFVHPLEAKVNAVDCHELPATVHGLFEYLPPEMIQEDGYDY
eukprot:CAMPEP_0172451472 /NCGR_PEP_ID=MMETSP1065-20121228/9512_1 /TAXON_ID=265537 /ORGANISM="Amphiprora paludosa, Strain CCMP125" /LENGTH=1015 /DNA_ID=CAMNT_0013203435 /DNA_START=20 /DNA_END=3067 /DNA_ORIENTATION=-